VRGGYHEGGKITVIVAGVGDVLTPALFKIRLMH